jgi:four helix bundle protein
VVVARSTEQFEDVIAWQKARELTRAVYETTKQSAFARDWGLTGQIQRSAVSIMANVAEGFERGKPKEYLQFLLIAKASCAEVRSHLYVALDSGYLDEPTFLRLRDQARETSRVISGLRAAIERHQSLG